jgi:aerobic-type carbon monoxide dehydrogenase small subunit (CoxS/CutS family)
MSEDALAVSMTVNGRKFERNVEPRMLLADFLRGVLGFTGTHVGCAHGVCGACTVIVNGETSRSCLIFAVQMNGASIETVESLAGNGPLSVLQQAFHEKHALQCGFCTPGFLMAATQLLKRNANPTEVEIRRGLAGNLCRCTGYVNIVRAVKLAAERLNAAPADPATLGPEQRSDGEAH